MATANTTNAQKNVTIVKFGHFYNEGERGARGNAPQNDKVWGIAKIGTTTVNFWGRRNGVLKFKTCLNTQLGKVAEKWEEKIGGRTDGGDIYTPVTSVEMIATLCPTLEKDVSHFYYKAMASGKLNTNH